jgi:hypothetical protein
MNDQVAREEPEKARQYVLDRYDRQIEYYWKKSSANKRGYKWYRYMIVVFGALVTLAAALSSSTFIKDSTPWPMLFAIATPVLAALLTILNGFSQSFQWGAAWREMVLSAERLEKERDRIKVSPAGERDPVAELEYLNSTVLEESQGFFDRILGRSQAKTQEPK